MKQYTKCTQIRVFEGYTYPGGFTDGVQEASEWMCENGVIGNIIEIKNDDIYDEFGELLYKNKIVTISYTSTWVWDETKDEEKEIFQPENIITIENPVQTTKSARV